jgi:hypothetical protein
MKMYLGGCSGIKKPVDLNGVEVNIGDRLSYDYGDSQEIKDWMKEPIFIVEEHKSGKGLCARGINQKLFLHDFRFKYCEILNA